MLFFPEQAAKLPLAAPEHLTLARRLLPSPAINLVVINRMMVDKNSYLSARAISAISAISPISPSPPRLPRCKLQRRPAPSNLAPMNISSAQHTFSF